MDGLDNEAVLLWLSDCATRLSDAAFPTDGDEGDEKESASSGESEGSDASAESSEESEESSGEESDGDEERTLPAGWEEAFSEEYSRVYWANKATGESSWVRPE